jgi:hypothetical protein
MDNETERLEQDIAALRDSVAGIRSRLGELSGSEIDSALVAVAACVSELLPLRLSLDNAKAARKNSH